MTNIGARIKQRRKELGYSAEKLAELVKLSPATIYRYEKNDIANMGADKLRPIAAALSTTPGQLMGWDDDPSEVPTSLQPNPVSLTPDETNLLDNYRVLNTEGKSIARTTVQSLAANPDLRKDTSSETA